MHIRLVARQKCVVKMYHNKMRVSVFFCIFVFFLPSTISSFRDDDDINDVASMAGVNLNEESARILATNSDLVGTQIRSCKDEAFLHPGLLHRRIQETGES